LQVWLFGLCRQSPLFSRLKVVAGGGIGSNQTAFSKASANSETRQGTQDIQITLLTVDNLQFFAAGQSFA
jgi:hypothetical protein